MTQALTPPWLPSSRPIYSQHPAVDTAALKRGFHGLLLLAAPDGLVLPTSQPVLLTALGGLVLLTAPDGLVLLT